ncbi:MAG: hypothetical protein ACRERV_15790 [Methylococcales bacterium]
MRLMMSEPNSGPPPKFPTNFGNCPTSLPRYDKNATTHTTAKTAKMIVFGCSFDSFIELRLAARFAEKLCFSVLLSKIQAATPLFVLMRRHSR